MLIPDAGPVVHFCGEGRAEGEDELVEVCLVSWLFELDEQSFKLDILERRLD